MGFLGSFLGKVAGDAVNMGVEMAKQKIAENQALEAEKFNQKYKNAAYRLPKGFCEGANGKVWRVIDTDGKSLLLLRIKVSGGKEFKQWFNLTEIQNFYENI